MKDCLCAFSRTHLCPCSRSIFLINAIGMTAVGGMLLLAHGTSETSSIIPDSPAHWMGAIATALSFVNIIGGFLITGKMLDLFRRPEDPDDYFEFYAIPSALLVGGLAGSYLLNSGNFESVAGSVGIAAAVCCIAASEFFVTTETMRVHALAIFSFSSYHSCYDFSPEHSVAGLADQKSARTGNILGVAGVGFGLAATTADMSLVGAAPAAFQQVGALAGLGGAVGAALASKVGPTELPQTVAAFHSLGKCRYQKMFEIGVRFLSLTTCLLVSINPQLALLPWLEPLESILAMWESLMPVPLALSTLPSSSEVLLSREVWLRSPSSQV